MPKSIVHARGEPDLDRVQITGADEVHEADNSCSDLWFVEKLDQLGAKVLRVAADLSMRILVDTRAAIFMNSKHPRVNALEQPVWD